MKLPENYINRINELLKDEAKDYFDCLDEKCHKGLRVNNLKLSPEDFLNINSFELSKIPFIDNGYYVEGEDSVSKHPYYHAGLYYLQEPSAMLPANRLPIEEHDFVLDLCAAPGGKATELASKLNGTGILYANDISASRAKALLKNLENAGAKNIYVTAENPEKLAENLPQFFNKILVDAPCSGEGMFRKDDTLIDSYIEHGPEYYAPIQKEILESAYKMLAKGGLMMYSTCTFSIKEDEENIAYLLSNHDDLSLEIIKGYEGFSKGFSEGFDNSFNIDRCVRVFPHKMKGEGHFLALIKKAGEAPEHDVSKVKEYTDKNGCIYHLPGYKDNGFRKSLRYLRTGLFIGENKNNKLKYSNAYALSLKAGEFDNNLSLTSDDIRVEKYLKGETIFLLDDELDNVKKGYVLILLDKYPLGFAVSDGRNTLKNMYNKGWRIN